MRRRLGRGEHALRRDGRQRRATQRRQCPARRQRRALIVAAASAQGHARSRRMPGLADGRGFGGQRPAPRRGSRGRLSPAALGHRLQQRARVGVGGLAKQRLGRALFDDAALAYSTATSSQTMVHHRQVVADEQVGDAELLLQVLHQVQHLRLHRDVERAHRLVGDDQARPRDQRARDGDALALAAGNSCGYLAASSAPRPTASSASAARARCSARAAPRACAAARTTMLQTVRRGSSEPYGSWNTIWSSRARRAVRPAAARAGRCPEQHLARGRPLERHHQPRQRRLARARFADHAQAAAGCISNLTPRAPRRAARLQQRSRGSS